MRSYTISTKIHYFYTQMIPINVKIKPGAFKDEIILNEEGKLIIKIREKPIDGAANVYLIKFLAKEFNLSKSDVVIEKGLSSSFKKLLLNISPEAFKNAMSKYKKSE